MHPILWLFALHHVAKKRAAAVQPARRYVATTIAPKKAIVPAPKKK
jgi:hypothetical protein